MDSLKGFVQIKGIGLTEVHVDRRDSTGVICSNLCQRTTGNAARGSILLTDHFTYNNTLRSKNNTNKYKGEKYTYKTAHITLLSPNNIYNSLFVKRFFNIRHAEITLDKPDIFIIIL